ncbi:hypothetical protein ACFC08_40285 [Streptomyces sp. NPDC056112]|uniref:hypothetical protein n=1 Tax=unclassified Streptomyces TaxID=2593676 RepID=UPI001CD245EB|nr:MULTISPECIES: hypothetical protein [unclassified Streptomyces]
MHAETHLILHRTRAAELQAQATAHHAAARARQPGTLRAQLGWTLVELGLRLAAAPRTAPAVSAV